MPIHTLSRLPPEHGIGKKSASQVSFSWRKRLSRVLTNADPLPSLSRASDISALPERSYVARLRVAQPLDQPQVKFALGTPPLHPSRNRGPESLVQPESPVSQF